MALEISYFSGYDPVTRLCLGQLISSVSVTLTSTSASMGARPLGATVARIKAGETCRVSNNGFTASATNGLHLNSGEYADIGIFADFLALTA